MKMLFALIEKILTDKEGGVASPSQADERPLNKDKAAFFEKELVWQSHVKGPFLTIGE